MTSSVKSYVQDSLKIMSSSWQRTPAQDTSHTRVDRSLRRRTDVFTPIHQITILLNTILLTSNENANITQKNLLKILFKCTSNSKIYQSCLKL